MALQFRRGTDSDRLTITPAAGEPIFTSDTKELFIGDGSTTGGVDLITTKLGSISGDIVPDTDSAYDLGSPTKKFKDLHLSGNSIFLGDGLILSNDGGTFAAKDSDNNPVVISLTSNNTGQLSEGTNLYYTTARADSAFDVRLATKTTANVTEGSNLYFTDVRADARITNALLDEDNMASNSATKIPSQQSVKAYVDAEVAGIVDTAPAALNTLNELAAALGDDANFSTTITNSIAAKLDSSAAIAIIDSAYVQARTTAGTDSAATISLIGTTVDSAYVQARQTSGGGSIDSAATIALIDSAYVQSRQTSGGIDSAATTALVDSAYVQGKQITPVSSFNTIAVSGQTNIIADSAGTTNYAVTAQQGILQASNRGQDYFGERVAIDNGYAIVNSTNEDTGGSNAGSCYIYVRSGTTWTQQQHITSPISPPDGHYFGTDVDIEGSRVVIGSTYDDTDYNHGGGVHVYTRSGTTWSLEQRLASTDIAANDWFGNRVAISGNYIVASAHKKNSSEGAVYVFKGATSTTLQGSSYDSVQSVSLNSIESQPKSMLFNSDGTKVFIVGMSADAIKEYSLATPYDISTNFLSNASSSYSLTISGENNMGVYAMRWNSDGTKVYVLCTNNMKIYQHNLTTAYDISTASYSNKNFSTTTQENAYMGFTFNNDGTSMYLCGSQNNKVFQYTLSTADDISTASYANKSFTHQASYGGTTAIQFDESGKKLFILGTQLRQHDLATAFDVSSSITVSYAINILTNATQAGDFTFNADMSKLYAVEPGADKIFQFSTSGASTVWTQQAKLLASDNTTGDKFGFDVAIDGDTIAIGAAVADTGGKVYAFTRSGSTWSQQAAFTSSDISSEDEFGGSVSISGNTILVGAYSSGGTSSVPHGAAYAFTRSGSTWSQQAKIQPSDTPNPSSASIAFAYRQLTIQDNIAVIGHSTATNDGTANVGAAYIFERSGTTWTQVYKFGASDAFAADGFGHGVDISGKDIIVGAPWEDAGKGQAYTFVLPDVATYSDTLTLAAGLGITITTNASTDTVTIDGTAAGNDSATTIALIDSAYVQARTTAGNDSAATISLIGTTVDSDYVQVRQVDPVSAFTTISVTGQTDIVADADGAVPDWTSGTQQAKIIRVPFNSIMGSDGFGRSPSLSSDGNYAVVGSGKSNNNRGAIHFISRSGSTWTYGQMINRTGGHGTSFTGFGDHVVMSNDGTIALGAAQYDPSAANASYATGRVYLFTRSGSTWSQHSAIEPTSPSAVSNDMRFGASVDISGDNQYIVIGGPGSGKGVYIYINDGSGNFSLQQKISGSSLSGDDYGGGVAIDEDGNTIVVSHQGRESTGKIYIYVRSGTTWSLQQTIAPSGAVDIGWDDRKGKGVAISSDGNRIAFGSGGPYTTAVSVYIWNRSGTTWTQEQNITPSHTIGSSTNQVTRFGQNVSLSNDGTRLVVGTDRFNTLSHAETGITYAFTRNSLGVWSESKILSPSDLASEDQFGLHANISGDGTTILVNSKLADLVDGSDTYTNAGAVYAFTAPVGNPYQDTLTFEAGSGITITTNASTDTVTIAGSAAGNDSATTIALIDSAYVQARQTKYTNADFTDSAYVTTQINSVIDAAPGALNTLNELAAALGDDANFSTTITNSIAGKLDSATTIALVDSAYVQVRQTTPIPSFNKISISGQGDLLADADTAPVNWASGTQQQKLTASDTASNDRFGYDLDISGDGNYALVAAPWESTQKGKAYVYLKSGTTWTEQATLTGSSTSSNDYFGMGIKISEDGSTAVIGAKGAGSGLNGTGLAYVFTRSGTSWSQQTALTASDAADGDLFGYAVDISDDGDTIAVGAYGEDTGGNARGQIYVYTRSGTTWSEQQKFQPSDVEDGDNTGFAVGISGDGDNIIAGVPFEDTNGSAAGSGYIFTRSGSTWSQQAKIQASDAAAAQDFGYSVDISTDGNTVALGSRDDTGGGNRGAAFIFTRSGTTWSQQAKIENSNEADYDLFASGGRGVSLSGTGNILVVGAYSDDDNGSQSGSTFVFARSGSTWSQSKQIATSDAAASDENGFAVAIDKNGETLLTGSYGKNSSAGATYVWTATGSVLATSTLTLEAGTGITLTTAAGTDTVTVSAEATIALVDSAYVQARQTTPVPAFTKVSIAGQGDVVADADAAEPLYANLTQQQKLTASDAGSNDFFGYSADIKGDYAVITAASQLGVRAAYVFTRSGTTWTQQAKLTPSSTTSYFGSYVAMSTDTNYIIVGSPNYSTGGGGFVFVRSGTSWSQQAILVDSGVSSGNEWQTVAISSDGTYAVIGSVNYNSSRGRATVFIRSGTTWTQQAQFTGVAASDYLGVAISISDNGATLALGAQLDDDADGNAGTVHVHTRSGTTWSSRTVLTASDAGGSDYLGGGTKGVDINEDGTLIAAGAYAHNTGSVGNSGAVYVFKYSGSSWSQAAKITPPSNVLNQGFGHQVAISGNTVTVSYSTIKSNLSSATCHVYTTTDESTWTLTKTFTASDIAAGMDFGRGLAIDNAGTIVVGAPGTYGTSTSTGAAYVFTAPMGVMLEDTLTLEAGSGITLTTAAGTDTVTVSAAGLDSAGATALVDSAYVQARQTTPVPAFTKVSIAGQGDVVADADAAVALYANLSQQAKLTASDAGANDYLGFSVDIKGDYGIVGAQGERAAYVFTRSGTTWTQQAKISYNESAFGMAVALSTDTNYAIIGSQLTNGHARVYLRTGTSWALQATLAPSDRASSDEYGGSVSISSDGTYAVVGGSGDDSAKGAAVVFIRSGTSWSQQAKITEPARENGARFGTGVKLNDAGNVLACSSPLSDEAVGNAGAVFVFTRSGTTWSWQSDLVASDAGGSDYMGSTASGQGVNGTTDINEDGTLVVAGAHGHNTGGVANAGAAYVWKYNGSSWSQVTKLTAPSNVANENYGEAVAISGNTIVVGQDNAGGGGTGAKAYVYTTTDESTWTLTKTFTASDVAAYLDFGFSVAIDNAGTILVGAPGTANQTGSTGQAYVFTAPMGVMLEDTLTLEAGTGITLTTAAGTDTVTIAGSAAGLDSAGATALIDSDYVQARQITPISSFNTVTVASVDVVADSTGVHWPTTGQNQKVTASDAANNDFFGNVVDIDGDYAVVGARGNKAAYILYYNGSAWTEQQKIQETTFGSNFGHAVSIVGDTVLIGSHNEDGSNADGSKAYVYTRSGTTWSLQQKVDPSQADTSDFFGYQKTMKLDKTNNDQFIAGSYSEDETNSNEGAVYIFNRSGSTWSETQRIVPSDKTTSSNFGISADIAGDYAIFGGNNSVYVYYKSGGTWSQQQKIANPYEAGNGHSGPSNAVNFATDGEISINAAGDTIAVGARGQNNLPGYVFVFTRSGTTWTLQQALRSSNTANDDMFGWSVSLDGLGNSLTVGAKTTSTGGKAYIFTRTVSTWTEVKDFTASDVAANWEFGEGIGISRSNDKIIVGARQYSSSANGQGAAYIFNAGATAKYSDTLTLEAGTGITLTTNASTDTVTIAGSAVDELISIDSDLTTTDSDQVIHSFSKTSFRTMKYVAQLKHAGDNTYHSQEILLTHNGTNVAITGYAKLLLDSDLGEFDAAINGSNVELRLTPTKTNTNVKLKAISTTV